MRKVPTNEEMREKIKNIPLAHLRTAYQRTKTEREILQEQEYTPLCNHGNL